MQKSEIPKALKAKISEIKTAFPLISSHLAQVKTKIRASSKPGGIPLQELEREMEAFEPLLKELHKQRKRIIEHKYYKLK